MKSVYLREVTLKLARFAVEQERAIEWIARAHAHAEQLAGSGLSPERVEKLVRRYAVSPDLILVRRTDFQAFDRPFEQIKSLEDPNNPFRVSQGSLRGAPIDQRMKLFTEKAIEAMSELYSDALQAAKAPNHLIHVTCTGYDSPSAAHRFVTRRGWRTEVTQLYHMGCFASLPAIRLATALARESTERVDVVHNELCSLHFDPTNHTPEQIVVQTLFADGHARYSLSLERPEPQQGFEVLATLESQIPETEEQMTWKPGPFGMQMTLSRDVPSLLQKELPRFVKALLEKNRDPSEIDASSIHYAIHPGGPKVLEGVASALNLEDGALKKSFEVLRKYGNISSATLPHIWEAILAPRSLPSGTPVVSLAFGPGLTIFGSLMRVV